MTGALTFLVECFPLRAGFEHTQQPTQHLPFIPCLGKETQDGGAGEWAELQVLTPSNTGEEQDEAEDGRQRRRPNKSSLGAHGCKVSCIASPWEAKALLKGHFDFHILIPCNALSQCTAPE